MKKPETLQDYFDVAWDWAVVQKQPPSLEIRENNSKQCVYRTSDGRKCLIGAAIDDNDYHEKLEGNLANFTLGSIGYAAPNGINSLQKCHDLAAVDFPDDYQHYVEIYLRYFASRHQLAIPTPIESVVQK